VGARADPPVAGERADQQQPAPVLVLGVRLPPLGERPAAVLVLDLDTQPRAVEAESAHDAVASRVGERVGDEFGDHQDGVVAQFVAGAPRVQYLAHVLPGLPHRGGRRGQAEHLGSAAVSGRAGVRVLGRPATIAVVLP
jgi:hypothetical protein